MPDEFADLMLKGLPMPALLVDGDERIVSINDEAERLLGKMSLGRLYMLPLRQPALREAIAAALKDGRGARVRHVVPGPSQEQVHMVTVSPILGQKHRAVLCVFEDVTGHEQVEQMRRDFVANVSHELRTPLTALLGFIETLRGAARDDAAARDRFLNIMEREAGRMNRLVRDLLHLSRVEAEERIRPTDPVDPVAVVQSALSSLKPLAEAHGVMLDLKTDSAPRSVPADGDQLMQVITNLTENAIKYGGADRPVTVRLSREVLAKGPMLRIDVVDRGEGIAAEHLPRLTERFYRVDAHRSREKGGTGLGLAIVKHIVHRHRGTFRIDSRIGEGSTFTVYFPEL
ncbi:ATP-binding protein [Neotabrizicola shimadae]|uniref:histidine kinase n=1 Tax=Neotabrizicola shimadae TaxID=2807096 RepID=A0A8G0ZXY2_9RHOB|nr:ATP-binding protein [Neotabrizicola shimadae]QYZ70956.1 PAS domain-containing protein [Neotabrizicola shimadae]